MMGWSASARYKFSYPIKSEHLLTMKSTLLRVLRNRVAWVLITIALGALGVKLSPETQQAIIQLGPAVATEVDQ